MKIPTSSIPTWLGNVVPKNEIEGVASEFVSGAVIRMFEIGNLYVLEISKVVSRILIL